MLKNYIKIAFRNLVKNSTFSVINIVGLTAGTLCCLYILIYVKDQYSYDQHHAKAGSIFRITSLLASKGDTGNPMGTTSPPVGPALKRDFPEVEQYTRMVIPPGVKKHLFSYRDKSFYETEGVFADSTFFQLFDYHFVYGNSAAAIHDPYSIVLTRKTAEKLFAGKNPIGEVVQIDNSFGKHGFKVTGVVDDQLGKSHINANFFMSMNSGGIGEFVRNDNTWIGNNFVYAYIRLAPTSAAEAFTKKLPAFLDKYAGDQLRAQGRRKVLNLLPVPAIHTSPGYGANSDKPVSTQFLSILLVIAALVQFTACINFMNLSTARSAKRAKEVGVRKVAGAAKGDLVRQFLGESLMLSVFAILLALPLLWLLLPFLNQLSGSAITLSFFKQTSIWLMVTGLVLLTGLLAGSYPAFYLSGFNITSVIKGNFSSHVSAANIRRGLVTIQFVVAVVLISGILVVNFQLKYLAGKDLGYATTQRIIIPFNTPESRQHLTAYKNLVAGMPGITSVSNANNYPSQFIFNDIRMYGQGQQPQDAFSIQYMVTNLGFVKTMGIKLISGHDFTGADEGRVLVNEATIRELGIRPENAEGARMYRADGDTLEIAGVMKDFNVASLHEKVNPFMLRYSSQDADLPNVIVATGATDYQQLLGRLEASWKRVVPLVPFEYNFLDEQVSKQYESEITLARIINAFTGVAILISCLGLFGLSAFTAEQRAKELSIRKILGASVQSLAGLLSKEFLKLVLLASLIAIPIAWYATSLWLRNFEYRISLTWWMFALAGLAALIVAIITVSFQSLKAAVANPVSRIRSE
ncbi:ABC transporter permease [Hufsiella ginkgonis]|uniref:FtsX-like permease family protein n=1 Tax=Hufsiella ginkgonis TaxID=2695274 RepID=A0A7K1XWG0_9SPHI|nr:ABC transporter permease [Hufsiella ginkgonis]MXV14856.1 FtsX-like permease family protein [Hufsiella ginkgonis]